MYYRAIEGSDSGLWVYNVPSGTCFLSDRYYTMLGYEPNEFEGTNENLFALLHPDDVERTNRIFEDFYKGVTSKYRNEVRLKNKSGSYTNILTQGIGERNQAGEVETFIGWNIDITPLKEAQRLLDEERAKSASQSRLAHLGLLSAGVTHEINNPLMVIKLRSQLMMKSIANRGNIPTETLLTYLEAIQDSANKIESIVKGLRTIANGGNDDEQGRFSINQVLEEVLFLCRAELEEQQVSVNLSAMAEVEVEGNITLMGQVFLNLIDNSIDALKDRPLKKILITLSRSENDATITFEDNGPGVEEKNRDKIFLPFFTTKAPGEGTGMGLSISASIIQAHRGSIEYSFEKGRSIFTIHLPIH